jgi:hypothetical protein
MSLADPKPTFAVTGGHRFGIASVKPFGKANAGIEETAACAILF